MERNAHVTKFDSGENIFSQIINDTFVIRITESLL